MTKIELHLDGDGCWPDLREKAKDGKYVPDAELVGVALIPDAEVTSPAGETRRVPVLTLRIDLPDGTSALAQVKVRMLGLILGAVRGRLAFLAELKEQGGESN